MTQKRLIRVCLFFEADGNSERTEVMKDMATLHSQIQSLGVYPRVRLPNGQMPATVAVADPADEKTRLRDIQVWARLRYDLAGPGETGSAG